MKEQAIARRYARALIKVAKEKSALELFGDQLKGFAELCARNAQLASSLGKKSIDPRARENVVRDLQKKLGFDVLVGNFICILVRKGRVSALQDIALEYAAQLNVLLGREDMIVASPKPLDDDQYKTLVDYFSKRTGHTMILNKKSDASLLGGVKVQIGDKVFDYTLKSQMDLLKTSLLAH